MSFHATLNQWLAGYLGETVIAAYQGGDRPATPYVMTNITDVGPLYQVPRDEFRECLDMPDENGGTAETVTDVEYRVSVHAYGDDPRALLTPLIGVRYLTQAMHPMLPWKLQEVGQIQFVPEMVNTEWEDRAIVRLIFHGVHRETRDGDVVETVADITVEEAV